MSVKTKGKRVAERTFACELCHLTVRAEGRVIVKDCIFCRAKGSMKLK